MRRAALALALGSALIAASPSVATAAPTLSRSAADPGQLVLQIPSVPGEYRYYFVTSEPHLVFKPDLDRPPPVEPWSISAPDCSQDPQNGWVTCTAPVSSLSLTTGDGDEGFSVTRSGFPLLAALGGGSDFIGGGVVDDLIDTGPGADLVRGDKGDDRIVGGLDDDQLFGGPGADVIDGDLGIDRLFGDAGFDRLLARDGVKDKRIDCGKGNDRKERAKVDAKDPRARSC